MERQIWKLRPPSIDTIILGVAAAFVAVVVGISALVMAPKTAGDAQPISMTTAAEIINEGGTVTADGSLEYTIPNGTGAKIAAGATLDVLPNVITLHVGQKLIIRNLDSVPHDAGVLSVRANDSASISYTSVQEFQAICTIHRSGQISVHVVP